jgi:ubiquinone/menaquinone biosynthesis C-methylase UbiE
MSDQTTASPPINRPVEQQPAAWGAVAPDYHAFAGNVTRPFAEDAARLVPIGKGTRVIDVAAGTGNFTFAAARRGADVLATDFSSGMIEYLRAEAERQGLSDRVRTAVMDGQQLDAEDESFDVSASIFGVLFFPDPDKGLRELSRVLIPGGRAVVSTWAPPPRGEMGRIMGDAMAKAMPNLTPPAGSPAWAALGDADAFRQRLLSNGFARAHVVELRHVWVFDRLDSFTALMAKAAPPAVAMSAAMTPDQRARFGEAVVEDFRSRQGDGPYALTHEGMIAVGTK